MLRLRLWDSNGWRDEYAELVAFWVGNDDPVKAVFALFPSDPLGAELLEALDLGVQVLGAEVEVKVHAILDLLRLRNLL